MELVNFVKGVTEVVDFTREVGGWQEVLIERSGPPVQSGKILPHGVGMVDFVKGLTEVVDFTRKVDGKKS